MRPTPGEPSTGYVAGIDGGGTSTRCWVAGLDGTVAGRGEAGPSNPRAIGPERSVEALREAAGLALQRAGARAGDIAAVVVGLAGGAGTSVGEAVEAALRREFMAAQAVRVVHDARIALAAATGGGPGIILVAGTGSVAYGMDEQGREARAGGWGYLLGDEGSAYDIGRRAVGAVLRAADGRGPATALARVVEAGLGSIEPQAIIDAVYSGAAPRERIAGLARGVLQVARGGDRVAEAIVRAAAGELARLVAAVDDRLRLAPPVRAYASGGLLAGHPGQPPAGTAPGELAVSPDTLAQWLLAEVARRLQALRPGRDIRLEVAPRPPVAGAVLLALEAVLGESARTLVPRLSAR
ncbi:BadF/BadG/BcrA/BcrD ATPase family protein [Carboxydochorda subterranea]|uniref:BadF/BadG/BcrA/BcrD ATPase family protein n=1 Tax=Carboxydichorda subterranea TaxID=3109565 RepID=A0ABZ1BU10_9FIRM|nr:BadF/BadG/BcrA/BcrD ATPase family protein [Limnochorda sp. L945t]WRP16264.1 BadF/BadG/BcrA/BcrD ATPase family protein [Limnochorda sp. L945t]